MTKDDSAGGESVTEYVTVMLDGQWFGLPIRRVQDVFMPQQLTRVPLSGPEIAGILNLRGRIVTAVDLRCRLGLPPRPDGAPPMAVGIEWHGESYGLLVDAVGEVLKLAAPDASPIRSISMPSLRACRMACTGSMRSSWSCSTSSGCSTRQPSRSQREPCSRQGR
jgi:chemotaxis signal transduction protein